MEGLYDAYMGSLKKLLASYSDSELSMLTEFINKLIQVNYEQAGK
jgi:hypothetical protein